MTGWEDNLTHIRSPKSFSNEETPGRDSTSVDLLEAVVQSNSDLDGNSIG